MPSRLSWRIGRAATLLKILLQYFGKSLEALPGVAYPGFRDNRSTLNTKTGLKKTHTLTTYYQQTGRICGTDAVDTVHRQSGSCSYSAEMQTGMLVST